MSAIRKYVVAVAGACRCWASLFLALRRFFRSFRLHFPLMGQCVWVFINSGFVIVLSRFDFVVCSVLRAYAYCLLNAWRTREILCAECVVVCRRKKKNKKQETYFVEFSWDRFFTCTNAFAACACKTILTSTISSSTVARTSNFSLIFIFYFLFILQNRKYHRCWNVMLVFARAAQNLATNINRIVCTAQVQPVPPIHRTIRLKLNWCQFRYRKSSARFMSRRWNRWAPKVMCRWRNELNSIRCLRAANGELIAMKMFQPNRQVLQILCVHGHRQPPKRRRCHRIWVRFCHDIQEWRHCIEYQLYPTNNKSNHWHLCQRKHQIWIAWQRKIPTNRGSSQRISPQKVKQTKRTIPNRNYRSIWTRVQAHWGKRDHNRISAITKIWRENVELRPMHAKERACTPFQLHSIPFAMPFRLIQTVKSCRNCLCCAWHARTSWHWVEWLAKITVPIRVNRRWPIASKKWQKPFKQKAKWGNAKTSKMRHGKCRSQPAHWIRLILFKNINVRKQ